MRDRASYLLQQGKIRFVLTTSPLGPEAAHRRARAASTATACATSRLWVDDARDAFAKAVERGATPVQEPEVLRDDDGEVVIAAIGTYGDTIHSLVERRNYRGLFLPGFVAGHAALRSRATVGLKYVDHCVGNVELGKMNEWVELLRAT